MRWPILILLLTTTPLLFAEGRRYDVPETVINWKGTSDSVLKDYTQVLAEFTKMACTSQTRQQFEDLNKSYRAVGFYIPMLGSSQVDTKSIKANMPLLLKKLAWIEGLKKNLNKARSFPQYEELGESLQKRIDQLLEYKKSYQLATRSKKKNEIRRTSHRDLKKLIREFNGFTKKIPFLLSFGYPVDHFAHRFAHENLKRRKKTQKANEMFLQRQIIEDGAKDADHSHSDIYLRTTLDTVALQLKKQNDFLTDDPRFDLEWVLGLIKKNLNRGKATQLERLSEWESRTRDTIDFYQRLLSERNPSQQTELAANKASATRNFRAFVLRQHAKVYEFFARQPELMQALFVFDQILLNEAGGADEQNYSDRRDIAQVVINRRYHTFYSQLSDDEPLSFYLSTTTGIKKSEIKKNRWLNVMFKDEQFSFTLYFMPAVQMVFCPDMSSMAQSTRKENLIIALEALKEPQTDFHATRYFSRFSMIGKIDMGPMWEGHVPLPPSPGRELTVPKKIKKALAQKKYRYLYDFRDSSNTKFHVVEIQKRSYVLDGLGARPHVFEYRSPHHFMFFEESPVN